MLRFNPITDNIRAHDRVVATYEKGHDEIYNPVEQERIRQRLTQAISLVRTGQQPVRALDFGCGIGNLTSHLAALGARIVAADVSPKCLAYVAAKFRCETLRLNGENLSNVPDATFDLACTYSVLHHIPDYLHAVRELARVVKPGGIVVIDHEDSPWHWNPSNLEREFAELNRPRKSRLRYFKVFKPSWYMTKVRRLLDPRYEEEGDIHTWPDDHIEWDRIREVLVGAGVRPVVEEDYLLFRGRYRREQWEEYRQKCRGDVRILIARKD